MRALRLSFVALSSLAGCYWLISYQRPVLWCSDNVAEFDEHYPTYLLNAASIDVASQPRNVIELPILVMPSAICLTNHSLDLLFVVHSHVSNYENRRRMRRKYFASDYLKKHNAKVLFVVGGNETSELRREEEQFADIYQVRLPENYHSITQKARSWLSHVSAVCGDRIRYIIKMDDDILMDADALIRLLSKFGTRKRFIACRVFTNGVVVRNPSSKWYLSAKEYSSASLGLYCQGMAYVFSGDLLRPMVSNIANVQYLWMDDWYVTHALLNGTSALFTDIRRHYVSINSQSELDAVYKRQLRGTILFAHFRPPERFNETYREQIWNQLRRTSCI
uniref:Hexosyltransferase n=3 Tax=Parascaris TaxID=6254 RepID=A0A914ZK49_PARUN